MSYVVEDCRGVLKLSSCRVIRSAASFFPTQLNDAKYPSIMWRDLVFDPLHSMTSSPVFTNTTSPANSTIVFYIHGGGFCLSSRTMAPSHNLCLRLAAELRATVISVDYRLAPEHRLPIAVEDCWTALKWVCSVFSAGQGVFVFGESAGGNIAHNLAVRVAMGSSRELNPVRVKGYLLLAPMFGGSERTKSELEGLTGTFLSLEGVDRYWRLCLPTGETPGYLLANPFGPRSPELKSLDLGPMLVMVEETDILRDRVKHYASRLNSFEKSAKYVEFKGPAHGFMITSNDPEPSNQLLSLTKRFISENTG